MTWLEVLTDESKIGLHVLYAHLERNGLVCRLRTTDGPRAERHDLMSQETHGGRWIAFRQPVLREAPLERVAR